MKKKSIYVKDYGDMLAKVLNMSLIHYQEKGDYQGKYIAILEDDNRLYIYTDYYGSCSGCDWLQDNILDWDYGEKGYEIEYKVALKYALDMKPKYIVPYSDSKFFLKEVLNLIDITMREEDE